MNNKHNSHGILDNTIVSKYACKILAAQINDNLESIKSFSDSVITPTATTPMLENAPEIFTSLLKECVTHEHHRCIAC